MARRSPIPTAPQPPKVTQVVVPKAAPATPAKTAAKTPAKTGNLGTSGSAKKSSPQSEYEKALAKSEAKATAKENEAKRKAEQKYRGQALSLEQQAKALQVALQREYKEGLDTKLRNVQVVLEEQNAILMEDYGNRVDSLREARDNNDKAEAGQSWLTLTNAARERASALSEVAAQGGGESDALKSQLMSLRNWNANQSEVNRSYYDSHSSINSSLTDLNIDTRTARVNLETQANADKEQLWTNYFNQRSESFTQLGNIRGQQADFYGLAHEQRVGDGGGGKAKSSAKNSAKTSSKNSGLSLGPAGKGKGVGTMADSLPDRGGNGGIARGKALDSMGNFKAQEVAQQRAAKAFLNSAKTAGQAWDNPGVSDGLMAWQGQDPFEGGNNMSNINLAQTVEASKRPEGATLRKW